MSSDSSLFRILAVSCLSFICSASCGQSNWLYRAGGVSHDEALSVCTTPFNDYYVTGYFNAFGQFGSTSFSSSGFSDVFLEKTGSNGVALWAKKFGGAKPDRGTAVASDSLGNAYVTGVFTDLATFGSVQLNAVDNNSLQGFLTKINGSGIVQWAVQFGGINDDLPYDVAVCSDGSIAITGQFSGTAQFGPDTFTSAIDPDLGTYSMDIFTSKLSADGDWLWTKTGTAPYDDRGMSVVGGPAGKVYVTGQFSEDITFDLFHENEIMNSGFVLAYDQNGNESMFLQFSGSFSQPSSIDIDSDNNLLVAGDFQGQLAIFTPSIFFVNSQFEHNIFLMKLSPTGNVIWCSADGSNNEFSCRSMVVDEHDDMYLTGYFECVLTEYSDDWGPGLFNSIGFKDAFATKYNEAGVRQWERQFGGPRDDYSWGIEEGSILNKPILVGSFEDVFSAPLGDDFATYLEDDATDTELSGFSYGNMYCDDELHPHFKSMAATGAKDCFISSPVDTTKSPFDIYLRNYSSEDCSWPIVTPCIEEIWTEESCPDSVWFCNGGTVDCVLSTDYNFNLGPEYEIIWSTNDSSPFNYSLNVINSGWYSYEVERLDGCASFEYEFYVTITESPELEIADYCLNELPGNYSYVLTVCEDEVQLFGNQIYNGSEYDTQWSLGNESFGIGEEIITVNESGFYTFSADNETGCHSELSIYANFVDPDDYDLDAYIYSDGQLVTGDTAYLCPQEYLLIGLTNLLGSPAANGLFDTEIDVFLDGEFYTTTGGVAEVPFSTVETGMYTFVITPILPCCSGDLEFPLITVECFIYAFDVGYYTANISGGTEICPGDTVMLTVEFSYESESFAWSTPYGSIYNQDTIYATFAGAYNVIDQFVTEDDCPVYVNGYHFINDYPHPLAQTFPDHGVVCPGDSVELWVEPGLSYQWVGPFGELLSTEQSFFATVPGFYYCIQTNSAGCTLESNTIEVSEYNTPYLLGALGNEVCILGYVTAQVFTNDAAYIEWQAPLEGSDTLVYIYDAGTYSVIVDFCNVVAELEFDVIETIPESTISASQLILCDGDSVVLTANEGMEGYLWLPDSTITTSITVYESGIYTLLTTDVLGCIGNSGPFQVLNETEATPAPEDLVICLNTSAQINANSVFEVFWSSDVIGSDTLSNQSIYVSEELDEQTTFWVSLTDNYCDIPSQDAVVSINPNSLEPDITGDTSICTTGDIVLTAIGSGSSFMWLLPGGQTIYNDELVIYSPGLDDTGWYYLQGNDSQCESAFDSIYVTIEEPLNLAIQNTGNLIACVGDTVTLYTEFPATNYYWQTPNGIIEAGNEFEIVVEETDQGNYSLELEGTTCLNNYNTVFLDVYVVPVADFSLLPDSGCAPLLVTFLNNSIYDTPIFTTWDFGDGMTSNNPNASHYYFEPGTYNVSLTVETIEGCVWTDVLTDSAAVVVHPTPVAGFVANPTTVSVFDGEVEITDMSEGGISCYYEMGDGGESDECNFTYTFNIAGAMAIVQTVTNEFGCTDVDTVIVRVLGVIVHIPNTFTPNADEVNDVWIPVTLGATIYDLTVIDRWGNEVFHSNDQMEAWTGNKSGGNTFSQNDVYFYKLIVGDGISETQSLEGHVTLLR